MLICLCTLSGGGTANFVFKIFPGGGKKGIFPILGYLISNCQRLEISPLPGQGDDWGGTVNRSVRQEAGLPSRKGKKTTRGNHSSQCFTAHPSKTKIRWNPSRSLTGVSPADCWWDELPTRNILHRVAWWGRL